MIRVAKVAGIVVMVALVFPQVTLSQGSTPEPVFVQDDTIRPGRPQPPQGRNCPAN